MQNKQPLGALVCHHIPTYVYRDKAKAQRKRAQSTVTEKVAGLQLELTVTASTVKTWLIGQPVFKMFVVLTGGCLLSHPLDAHFSLTKSSVKQIDIWMVVNQPDIAHVTRRLTWSNITVFLF